MNATTRARYGVALAGAVASASLLILTGPGGGAASADTADTAGPAATTPSEPAPTTTEPTTATTATTAGEPTTTAPATTSRRQPWTPTTEPPTTTVPPATTDPPATTTTTAPATTTTTTTAPAATVAPATSSPEPETSVMPMDMEFVAAAGLSAPGTFSNPAKITIPEPGFVPPPWPGTPYPSAIAVAGLTGTVSDVNVTLPKLDCAKDPRSGEAWPEDFDLMMVGPTGASIVLMSDVGGDDEVSHAAPNLALTFDDSASKALPADAQLVSGTFRPTDDDDDRAYDSDSSDKDGGAGRDLFPAPAPAPGTATSLAVFNGTNPNGNWQLFASDDRAGFDRCEITNGWSLEILTQAGTQGTSGQTTTTQPAGTTTPGAGGPGTTTAPGSAGGTANAPGAATETARSGVASATRAAVAGTTTNRAVRTGPLASTGAPLALWTQTGFALMAAGTLLVRRTRRGRFGR